MTKYARIDGDTVVAIYKDPSAADIEALSLVPVPGDPLISAAPGSWYVLRLRDGLLEWLDARPLEQVKATKNSEINTARLTANRSTFTFAGKTIACDELSRSDIDGAHGIILMTQALPPGWPGGWKAVDNTYVSIPDVATWGAFYAAMVSQGMTNFAKAQTLKAQLAAATTVAEVEAVQW